MLDIFKEYKLLNTNVILYIIGFFTYNLVEIWTSTIIILDYGEHKKSTDDY